MKKKQESKDGYNEIPWGVSDYDKCNHAGGFGVIVVPEFQLVYNKSVICKRTK
jgi:hypothetical protein